MSNLKDIVQPRVKDWAEGDLDDLPGGWTEPAAIQPPPPTSARQRTPPPETKRVAGVKRDNANTYKDPGNVKSRRTDALVCESLLFGAT